MPDKDAKQDRAEEPVLFLTRRELGLLDGPAQQQYLEYLMVRGLLEPETVFQSKHGAM